MPGCRYMGKTPLVGDLTQVVSGCDWTLWQRLPCMTSNRSNHGDDA